MKASIRIIGILSLVAFSLVISIGNNSVYAGDDPSIKGELRSDIQASMDGYIKRNTLSHLQKSESY